MATEMAEEVTSILAGDQPNKSTAHHRHSHQRARVRDTMNIGSIFWFGVVTTTGHVGFVAALPVNYVMIRRGIRHQH